jgi:hypothetical protein
MKNIASPVNWSHKEITKAIVRALVNHLYGDGWRRFDELDEKWVVAGPGEDPVYAVKNGYIVDSV